MTVLVDTDAIARATGHYDRGELEQAEALCFRLLSHSPAQAGALCLLGLIAVRRADDGMALQLLAASTASFQDSCEDSIRRGDLDAACAAWAALLTAKSALNATCGRLTAALKARRQAEEIRALFERWSELNRAVAGLSDWLGSALNEIDRVDDAIQVLEQAAALEPESPQARNNLGIAYRKRGRFAEAIASCQEAIRLRPDFFQAHNTLGLAYVAAGRPELAVEAYRRAIELRPRYARAQNNLALAFQELGELDRALEACRAAIANDPRLAEAHSNLGNLLRETGATSEAIAAYQAALALNPGRSDVHSNLLYALHFDADCDGPSLLREHQAWAERHGRFPFAAPSRHGMDLDPGRPLRVGFISGDLREHPVGRFLLPWLIHRDAAAFQTFAYATSHSVDDTTQAIRSHTDGWRVIAGVSDQQVVEMVRQDGVDILIDLGMHTRGNRLGVFARKPAPVQVSYLAYCSTTGLQAIDYRLTDACLDPPALGNGPYVEESVRLASYWCYWPFCEVPVATTVPMATASRVTFGCLNQFPKLSPPFLDMCRRMLNALPDARLLLHALEGGHRRELEARMAARGVSPDRLAFVGRCAREGYMAWYNQIDVALDPFPYGGGTTTCDALWMGVPVVTLAGRTAVGRGGVSILSQLGLESLVAADPARYLEIATDLAGDAPRLHDLRRQLRARMKTSRLSDGVAFARDLEAALRGMWRRHCAARP